MSEIDELMTLKRDIDNLEKYAWEQVLNAPDPDVVKFAFSKEGYEKDKKTALTVALKRIIGKHSKKYTTGPPMKRSL